MLCYNVCEGEVNMISKKDLLKQMNISYGQLYRWKREGLIPDEWFNKQAVSTGQETYFKKDLIIPRIEKILELKDKYQLYELVKILEPRLDDRLFTLQEVVLIDDIDPILLKRYSLLKKAFSISEVAVIYILSKYQNELNIEDYINIDYSIVKPNDYFYLFDNNEMAISGENMIVAEKFKIKQRIKIEDVIIMISKEIN
ncbi:MAG: DUF4004 family protein [Bacilli bacterium]|nr:DUF4004 family protein [Bacilli bacterium]